MTDKSVVDVLDKTDVNVAATLRDIAANCDKTTGRVLRLCERAACNGKDHIIVKVSVDDRTHLYRRWLKSVQGYEDISLTSITPLVEKLESLGFQLCSVEGSSWGEECFIRVSW